MKKSLMVLLIFAGFIWLPAAAQQFSLELNRPVRITPFNTQAKIYTRITNLMGTQIEFSITREQDLPDGWSSSICFGLSCLRDDISFASTTIGPGETDSFAVYITVSDSLASGDVSFTVGTGKGVDKQTEHLTFTAITEGIDLLVVDSGREDDYESYVESLLPEGSTAATWNAWSGIPSGTDLAHFSQVYWLTGTARDALVAEARTAIETYLDGGGKLMISGQNIASGLCDVAGADYSVEGCTFLNGYLHAAYSADTAGAALLSGVAGDGLGHGLDFAITGGTGADNQSSPDGVTATNGGAAFLEYNGTDHDGGIRYASGDTRLVYLPFGLEGVADESSRQTIVDRAAAFFADTTAPEIGVGIFQNPYLTSYLDLYMIGSEALDAASLQMTVGGSDVTLALLDGYKNVWRGDYKLQSAGVVAVALAAGDIAGNSNSANSSFGAAKISAGRGGVAVSADGAAQLTVKPGTLKKDAFIVVASGTDRWTGGGKHEALPEMTYLSRAQNKNSSEYSFSPRNILGGETASISFSWDASRFDADDLNRLAIRRSEEGVPLETWVDGGSRNATAAVNELGAFSFGPDGDSQALRVDRTYALLAQNRPNPFNPVTTIQYEIRAEQRITLEIYDVAGRLVKSLERGTLPPGEHTAVWRGITDDGYKAPSGVYFARLVAGKNQQTRKITLIR